MRHPPRRELRPESPALGAEHSVFTIKQVRDLNVLDGTPESPQENCHKTRGSLLSLQELKIAQCTPSQLEMKPIPLHCLHSYPVFHIIQNKWLDFLWETTEIP